MFRKLLSAVLSLAMIPATGVISITAEETIVTPSGDLYVTEEEQGETGTEGILSAGGLLVQNDADEPCTIAEFDDTEDTYSHSHDEAILNAMKNLQSSMSVSGYGLTTSNVSGVINYIVNMHPEIYYYNGLSYSYNPSTGAVVSITFHYKDNVTLADIAVLNQAISAAEEELNAQITDSMTDLEKALVVHDYIAATTAYDYTDLIAGTLPDSVYGMYGVLVNHSAVCQGYAGAFQYFMNYYGINSGIASSETANHAWNIVEADGTWYQLDVTFDDPTWDIYGRVNHGYFMLSTDTLLAEEPERSDYVTVSSLDDPYTAAKDTSYESGNFWNDTSSRTYCYNGNWYYISSSASRLYVYNGSSSSVAANSSAAGKWTTSTGAYYTGCFARLYGEGNRVYYSTPSCINVYNLDTQQEHVYYTPETALTASSGWIYGFGETDGVMSYTVETSPNLSGTETYIAIEGTNAPESVHVVSDQLQNVKEASCAEDGYTGDKVCTVCGEIMTSGSVIPAKGHQTELVNVKDASCTEAGYTGDSVCTVCGETVTAGSVIPATGHVTELQNAKEATCTEAGYTGDEICTVCGETVTAGTAIPAAGHQTELVNAKEATCTETGYTGDKVCSVCGKTIEQGTAIPAKGHSTELQNAKEATCTEAGYTGDEICTVCGETITTGAVIPAAGHQTELVNAKEATCTEAGYTGDTVCSACGKTITQGTAIPAKGHQTTLVNAKEATYTEDGYTGDEVCTVCGETITTGEVIPKKSHVTEVRNAVEATCTTDGYTGDEVCTICGETITAGSVIPALGHDTVLKNAKEATCTAAGYTGDQVCSRCNTTVETGKTIAALGHTWDEGTVTKAATCAAEGSVTYTCTVCGETKTETLPIDPANHTGDTEVKNAVEATCTAAGYTGDTVCSSCGKTITQGTAISAKGHQTKLQNAKAATCTAAGYTGDYICTVCGETVTSGSEIPAKGHSTELQNAAEATCTTDGYTGNEVCTVCGEVIAKGTVIAAKGHQTKLQNAKAATCTATGYTGDYICTVCGETVTAGSVIPALGHNTVLKNAKEATCTAAGYTGDLYCSRCNTTVEKGKAIAAKGHTWDEGTVTTPAGTTAGVMTYTCTVCGKTKTETIAPLHTVTEIQNKLIALKYLTGTASGKMDSATVTALKKFQLLNSLTITGEADEETLSALFGTDPVSFRTLNAGMKGEDVKAIQKYLVELGYLTAEPDGSYGNYTKAAVTAFQAANGLENVDGLCGNWTMNTLASGNAVEFFEFKKGDQGTAVKVMQKYLVKLGYLSATPDGSFGGMSETALKKFQLLNGLTITGVADQATLYKLYHVDAIAFRTLNAGMKGEDVKAIQQYLVDLGYLTAEPDGSYGNYTKAAVTAFQAANGLENVDGLCGNWTMNTLASGNAVEFFEFQKGDQGTAVKVMQKYLVKLGYLSATPDGSFGGMSETALKKFQLINSLPVTGVADQATLYKLYHVNAIARRTLQVGSKGDDVKAVQQVLADLGYLTATPDGNYGNMSKAAVTAFQKANGLASPDGTVGNWTLGKLVEAVQE